MYLIRAVLHAWKYEEDKYREHPWYLALIIFLFIGFILVLILMTKFLVIDELKKSPGSAIYEAPR